jgi:hypothetical protein
VRLGVFENMTRDAGQFVEERGGYRLYECFIDATFSKARAAATRGLNKAGRRENITLIDARGLPL